MRSFELAVCSLVEADCSAFLRFLEDNKTVDNVVIQQVLISGLLVIAATRSDVVLKYLLEDDRRFAVGDFDNEHRESQELIRTVTPLMSHRDVGRLEKAICNWSYYSSVHGDRELRHCEAKWIRERRVRMLWSIPNNRLSRAGQKYLRRKSERTQGFRTET